MAKNCRKCGKPISKSIWIDGKQHLIRKRAFCLECVPFNSTKMKKLLDPNSERRCRKCNQPLADYEQDRCYPCRYASLYKVRNDYVYSIVGEKCWNLDCDLYGIEVERQLLEFHHLNPSEKSFDLHAGNIAKYGWDKIKDELLKCALLCVNCHREIRTGILENDIVTKIAIDFWMLNKHKLDLEPPKDPDLISKPKIPTAEEFLILKKEHSRDELMEKLGISSTTISSWAKQLGETFRKPSKKPTKEILEKLIWKMPLTKIAEKWMVSGSAVKKWAKYYGIEFPGRGYWAKPENSNYSTDLLNELE